MIIIVLALVALGIAIGLIGYRVLSNTKVVRNRDHG